MSNESILFYKVVLSGGLFLSVMGLIIAWKVRRIERTAHDLDWVWAVLRSLSRGTDMASLEEVQNVLCTERPSRREEITLEWVEKNLRQLERRSRPERRAISVMKKSREYFVARAPDESDIPEEDS